MKKHNDLSGSACQTLTVPFRALERKKRAVKGKGLDSTRQHAAATAAKSLQSCLTLCDPIDSSPPGSTVPGILQARTLEWAAISFSNAWKWKVKVKSLSRVQLSVTPWTTAYQASPSMGFSRQEYWSGLPLPVPKDFLDQIYNPTHTHKKNHKTVNWTLSKSKLSAQ